MKKLQLSGLLVLKCIDIQSSVVVEHAFTTPDRATIQERKRAEAQERAHTNNAILLNNLEQWAQRNPSDPFSTPEAKEVQTRLQAIQETPSKSSKEKAGKIVVDTALARIEASQSGSRIEASQSGKKKSQFGKKKKQVEANQLSENQQYDLLKHFPESNTKALLQSGAKQLSTPEILKKYGKVNIPHVLVPTYKFDENNKFIGSSGGHELEGHFKMHENVSTEGSWFGDQNDILVGQDNETIGLPLGCIDSKSVKKGMTEKYVQNCFHNGETIAKKSDNSKMRITRVVDENTEKYSYFGSYQDSYNPLLFPTIFPVIVVDEGLTNAEGKIYVGKFQQCDKQGNILPDEKEIYVQPATLQHIIKSGTPYKQKDKSVQITDIAVPLQDHLKGIKGGRNIKLPGVYALQRNVDNSDASNEL